MKEKEIIVKIAPMLDELRRRLDVYEFMKEPVLNSTFRKINEIYCERYKKEMIDSAFSCEIR